MTPPPKPFDPYTAAELTRRVAAAAAQALAHADTALAQAEAKLAIARHHHVRRLAHAHD